MCAAAFWLLLLICRFFSSAIGIVIPMATSEKNINFIVGKNIRAVREKVGLSQDDLSKLTILRKENFQETNFGEFILEGAFRIHPPTQKA